MKIVLDMNIPLIWEDFLNDAGHQAIHWQAVGDIRAEDVAIMQWARVNHFVVFTHDLDFGALLYATAAEAPSVIQLRVEHILPSSVGAMVLEALQVASQEIAEGALVTIDPKKRRVRLLPLRKWRA